jgi:hypothetical protein
LAGSGGKGCFEIISYEWKKGILRRQGFSRVLRRLVSSCQSMAFISFAGSSVRSASPPLDLAFLEASEQAVAKDCYWGGRKKIKLSSRANKARFGTSKVNTLRHKLPAMASGEVLKLTALIPRSLVKVQHITS